MIRTQNASAPVHAIEAEDLTATYGDVAALQGCTLAVETGSITALLGQNGAGKSTLLRILSTVAPPDSGRAMVAGYDCMRQPVAVRSQIGVVFQEQSLDRELTVERNLRMHARLYGLPTSHARARIRQLLVEFHIDDRTSSRIEDLSGGLARRVELARAILHHPAVLILDEPTVGLDPESRHLLWQDLHRLRDTTGVTVFYSTHYMDEADNADTALILRAGHIVANGSPTDLKARLGLGTLRLSTEDNATALAALNDAGLDASDDGGAITINTTDPESLVGRVVGLCPVPVHSLHVHTPSMDDVFLSHLRDEANNSEPASTTGSRA